MATDQWARGWPASQTPWPTDPTLQPPVGLLHGHALQEVVTRKSKLEVGGSQNRWPAGHKACSSPWTPINAPCLCNSRYHTLLVVLHL
jgi:hypothetical protein